VARIEPANLDQLATFIDNYVSTGAISSLAPPSGPQPSSPTTPGVATSPSTPRSALLQQQSVIQGNTTFTVPGGSARFVMPVWGWWAIGIGGVAAAGVLTYGILEQNWFGVVPKKRGKKR
jgi:hypothetical protein